MKKTAFSKINYIWIGISYLIVIAGFILMTGPGSTETYFNPDIFSAQRICVAPIIVLIGFLMIVFGILYTRKEEK